MIVSNVRDFGPCPRRVTIVEAAVRSVRLRNDQPLHPESTLIGTRPDETQIAHSSPIGTLILHARMRPVHGYG